MFTARAATIDIVISEIVASSIVSILARVVTGGESVALNAVDVVYDR